MSTSILGGKPSLATSASNSGRGGSAEKNAEQPHAADEREPLPLRRATPMSSADPKRDAVPVASGERKKSGAECTAARRVVVRRSGSEMETTDTVHSHVKRSKSEGH